QPERHGTITVLFDRSDRLKPPAWDEQTHRRRMCEALHQNLMKWQIYHGQFRKELARGRTVDAFACHLFLTLQPLLAVLGMRYRPHRWDFGYRYFKEEMPPEIVEAVERLCYLQQPEFLEVRFAEADALLTATVRELEKQGIIPLDPKGVDISPTLPAGVFDSQTTPMEGERQ
ncbi:MAG: hypothetical protein ACRD88_18960, partial [Terriglobia bacterium]